MSSRLQPRSIVPLRWLLLAACVLSATCFAAAQALVAADAGAWSPGLRTVVACGTPVSGPAAAAQGVQATQDSSPGEPAAVQEGAAELSATLVAGAALGAQVLWAVAGGDLPVAPPGAIRRVELPACMSIACRCVQMHRFRGPPLAPLPV